MAKVALAEYTTAGYNPGGMLKRLFWLIASGLFFETWLPWPNSFKRSILRCFGAKVDVGVVIKPKVKIKYPWFLKIGEHSWIGEHVWIDNLTTVIIKDNAVLSQGAFLLTGNHNYKSPKFDLQVQPIEVGSGAWVAAKSVVCPGVTIADYAVLSVASLANRDLTEPAIYSGNPCKMIRLRDISSES